MPRGDDSNVGQKPDGSEVQLQLDALDNLKVTLAGTAVPTAVNVEELDGNPIDLGAGNVGAGTQRLTIADDDAQFGTVGGAADVDGDVHGQLRYIGENIGSLREIVQACNDRTEFAALGDVANLADDANHITGSVAVGWDKTAGSNAQSGVEDTITSLDLSIFSPNDYVMVTAYIPDLTDVADVVLRLGTDNGNHNYWTWADTELTAGAWNILIAPVSGGTILGLGWDQSAVTYVAFEVNFDAAGDTLNSMAVDLISMISAESIGTTRDAGEIDPRTARVTIATDDTVATDLTAILAALLAQVPLPETTHKTPADGSATYTSSTTLTLAGLNFTITNNAQIVYVKQILADNTSKVWRSGVNCTLKQSGGVVTIYGAGTPFVTGDEYAVGINDQVKGFDPTQQYWKFGEQSPAHDWYTDFIDYTTFAPDSVAYVEGAVISTAGKTDINFGWQKTASTHDNNYIKVIYLDDSGSAVDYNETSLGNPAAGVTPVKNNVYEVDKAAGVNTLPFPTRGYPFMRIDLAKATDDGDDSTWVTRINKKWS